MTTEARRPTLRWRDRFILRLVRFAVFFLYETVEVYWPPGSVASRDRPVLAVSNHFGGFADPILLVSISPVVPRIVARDKIWKIPFAGWLMNWIGAIPVHKPAEHKGRVSNDEMFASCYEALAAGEVLLIFPEGITVEDPSIAPVKTGAARIALGARTQGTTNINVLPVGIHYEDKAALRSKVFIHAGVPIDLDGSIAAYAPSGDAAPDDRDAVDALTADIETHLRSVAPNFADWRQAKLLTDAAEVTLRSEAEDPRAEVSISERDRLAAELARRDEDAIGAVTGAMQTFDDDLAGLGLTDAQVHDKTRTGAFLGFLIRTAVLLAIAIPIALIGLTVNIWPLLLVGVLGFLPVGPAVKATIKPVGAMFFFAVAWGIALWGAFGEALWLGVVTAVLLPISLAALIYASERVVRLAKVARQWWKRRTVEAIEDQIASHRADVVAAVRAAVPATDS